MTVDADVDLTPNYIGPSWRRDKEGFFRLPERSLGWEIAGWCEQYLLDERSDDQNRIPWTFTNEQMRLLLWWYAVDDRGRFIYRQGVLQRMKGWGKDPFLAVIALVELCGPCRFDHWDADGDPVGREERNAWIEVAAVSREQTRNTMTVFNWLISDELKNDYSLDVGIEFIRACHGRRRIEAVTSSYRSLEGGRTTFTILNETHHWVRANNGILMYETVDGNATKGFDSRYMAITNAYLPGEDSVAERMRNAYNDTLEGRAKNFGFFYDSIEANSQTDLSPETLNDVVPLIRGDSVWLNPENIISSVMKQDISPARSRRMWLNQIVADEDALYQEADWDKLAEHGSLKPGDKIVMGFDGGKTDDSTALVAVRVKDGFVQPLMIAEKPESSMRESRDDGLHWEVDRDYVDSKVRAAFARYNVQAFYCDVTLWESYIAEWSRDYGGKLVQSSGAPNKISWDMRGSLKRTTFAHEALMREIIDGKVKHGFDTDDPLNHVLKRHVMNTRRRENNYGVSFTKEGRESPKKIDAYAALMLAVTAWNDLRQSGRDKAYSNQAWFF